MKKKILLPLDGSDRDLIAVNFLKDNFKPEETEVILLNVGEIVYAHGIVVSHLIGTEKEHGGRVLQRAYGILKDFNCVKEFQFGYADKVIIDYANDLNVDTIIMAKNTKGKYVPFIGSVTSKVLKKSKCTVIVLPQI